jgi:hypothetical protein
MLTVIMLAAFCQSPLEKLQYEVTALRAENTALRAMVYGPVKVPSPAPADAVPNVKVEPVTANIPASDFTNPTWHYAPGTVMVRDARGVLVPSQSATHISYPGQPMRPIQQAMPQHQPIQAPQFYQQPMRWQPPMTMMFGGNCVGSS